MKSFTILMIFRIPIIFPVGQNHMGRLFLQKIPKAVDKYRHVYMTRPNKSNKSPFVCYFIT